MTPFGWICLGGWALTGIVLGVWVYSRGTLIKVRDGEIAGLRKALSIAEIKGLTSDEKIARFRARIGARYTSGS